MQNLIPFQFENQSIRVVTDDCGEPLFVGKDICDALGYQRHSDAMQAHCKGSAIYRPLQTAGGVQEVRVLSEPDVLRLIISCNLPAADKFERWVFEDVLPTIRKTGAYAMPTAASGIDYEKLAEALSTKLDILNMSTEITDPRSGNTFNMSFLSAVKSILNHGERLSQLAARVEESAVVSNARAAVLDDLLSNVQKLKNLEHTTTYWQSEMKAMRTRMTKLEKLIAAGVVTE